MTSILSAISPCQDSLMYAFCFQVGVAAAPAVVLLSAFGLHRNSQLINSMIRLFGAATNRSANHRWLIAAESLHSACAQHEKYSVQKKIEPAAKLLSRMFDIYHSVRLSFAWYIPNSALMTCRPFSALIMCRPYSVLVTYRP